MEAAACLRHVKRRKAMAVEMTRIPIIPNRVISKYVSVGRPNLRLVDNSKVISSKISFQASMEKAMLSQKYWDELLEKLRKGGGGGGGGDTRFDRVAVSMQLMNFLSDKTIQAMLRNFTGEILNLTGNPSGQIQNTNQNPLANVIQRIVSMISLGMTNAFVLIIRRDVPSARLYTVLTQLPVLIGILSFQLNKLKEILEEDLKEFIKKLDVKEKIRKIKAIVLDFFVEMKEELLSSVKRITSELKMYLSEIYSSFQYSK